MGILIRLFLRKFRRQRYYTSLSIFVFLSILWRFLWGIAEELVFNTIVSHIGISGGGMSLILGLGIVAILIWMYIDARREFTSRHLQDTLTDMHDQMLHLKDTQLSRKKLEMKQVELVTPVLMHNLALIDIGDWDRFKKNMIKQLKRHITKRSQWNGSWRLVLSGDAAKIKKDLVNSKEWVEGDLDTVANWLDDQNWGLQELRKDDKRWNTLFKSIRPFMSDGKLNELIGRHMSLSYGACSVLLISGYSRKWRTSLELTLLHAVLIGSPIRPEIIDLELGKILGDIDKRMKVLKRRGKRK